MKSPLALAFLQIRILHAAMTGGVLLLAVVLWFIRGEGWEAGDPGLHNVFLYIAPAGVLGALIFGEMWSRQPFPLNQNQLTAFDKLSQYRTRLITVLAFAEAASLFCGVCYLITGKFLYLALLGAGALWMALQTPMPGMLAEKLELTPQETEGLTA